MKSPYLYSVAGGFVAGVQHVLGAGTRQGDPLSPAIFALVSSVVIYPLTTNLRGVEIMMYADDLIIFFPFAYKPGILHTAKQVMHEFGEFSGLRLNIKKTAAIVRNMDSESWIEAFQKEGITVRHWVRYLGIRLGNILSSSDGPQMVWGLTPLKQLGAIFSGVVTKCGSGWFCFAAPGGISLAPGGISVCWSGVIPGFLCAGGNGEFPKVGV